MKKTLKILIPIVLVLTIILSCCWYLFSYDQEFTRDALVSIARFCENKGYNSTATWFYNCAYAQLGDNDSVAIELAQQYKKSGNYTKAEYTLRNAIQDGGGIDLYIELCAIFVEQDKLLDAVNMLGNITDTSIKEQLEQMRPLAPTSSHESGQYNQYITVSVSATSGTLYVSKDGEYPSIHTDRYIDPIALDEGENRMYAVCVADNGLVSPLSVFGYTIGGIIKPVTFADPAVETLVRELLMIEAPTVINTNDLWKIKEFTVPANAKDYSDIALMTYLEKLTIEKAASSQLTKLSGLSELIELRINDSDLSHDELTAIGNLPKLKLLTLSDCGLSAITPLAKATQLEYLDLSSNAVRNLEPLNQLTNLKELHLQHNAVESLSGLSSLKALTTLDVSYNALTSLDGIFALNTLTYLNAEHTAITQVTGIGTLSALQDLNLKANKLSDISETAACVELRTLNIAENSITDITKLNQLVLLETLNFSMNSVTTIPTWSKNCALVTIDGSNNKIKSLEPLSGLKSLNKVYMDYNADISSVNELAKCPLLVEVNVYGTKVKSVSELTKQSVIVNYNPV